MERSEQVWAEVNFDGFVRDGMQADGFPRERATDDTLPAMPE